MGSLSNIRQGRALPLRSAAQLTPVKEPQVLPLLPQQPAIPETAAAKHSDTDINYSLIVADYPLLETLVKALDLVGENGERPKKVRVTQKPDTTPALRKFAAKYLMHGTSYTRAELIEILRAEADASNLRAQSGLNKMIEAGIIEATLDEDLYYLAGGTPF